MEPVPYAHCQVLYPVIHKAKVPFRPLIEIDAETAAFLRRIQELDAELDRFVPSQDDYFELVADAYSSNIHYSTKLEGNPLPLAEVKRLTRRSLAGRPAADAAPPQAATQEILNHLALWIAPDLFAPPWTHQTVQGIHLGLMMLVEPKAEPGAYRAVDSSVYTDQGQETFVPCPPKHIEREMAALLDWSNKSAPAFHPVVGATLLFHEFESIHPFLDGNGRVGRTMFHLYLQQHGLPNSHLCMVEKELTRDPELYYQLLGWTDQKGTYTELLHYFAKALLVSYEAAIQRFEAKDLLSSNLSETSKRLLVAARHKDWFAVSEAARWVDGVGDQTVRNRLNELTTAGVLEARGRTKARRYRFRRPLEELQRQVAAIHSPAQREDLLHDRVAATGRT